MFENSAPFSQTLAPTNFKFGTESDSFQGCFSYGWELSFI